MPQTRNLLVWLDGLPTIETVAYLLSALQARKHVAVKLFLPAGKFLADGPVMRKLSRLGLAPVPVSRLRSKFLFQRDLAAGDAVLVITDPALDRSSRAFRSSAIRRSGKPVIFVQHGAYQSGVNAPTGSGQSTGVEYEAGRLLLWQCTQLEERFLSRNSLLKVRVTGFIKKPFLPFLPQSDELRDWVARYRSRVLFCQSFRWAGARFGADTVAEWYAMLDGFLTANPDIGVVVRPHRGKVHRSHSGNDTELLKRHPNLLVSMSNEGPLKDAAIHDCVQLCHSVVCPESTVVLDSVYLDRPVMIMDEMSALFPELPRFDGPETLAAFARDPEFAREASQKVLDRFGRIDDNLSRACDYIEEFIGG